MVNTRLSLQFLAAAIMMLSVAMLLPMFVDFFHHRDEYKTFAKIALIGIASGAAVATATKSEATPKPKDFFLITTLIWLIAPFFTAIPYWLNNSAEYSFAEGLFESVSGITSCGASVTVAFEKLSPGMLLWRAMTNWLGGIGIIIIVSAISPLVRVGGMQLFQLENSENADKLLPKTRHILYAVGILYVAVTTILALAYYNLGMSLFDAICHSFGTVSNGGFSNYADSIGHFNSISIELVCMVGMVVSATPYMLYLYLLHRDAGVKASHVLQVEFYLRLIFSAVILAFWWLHYYQGMHWKDSLRYASFNVISVFTTTGYVNYDYSLWLPFPQFLLILVALIGGCTGSAAGGFKVFRLQVLFTAAIKYMQHLVTPHAIVKLHYGEKLVDESLIINVASVAFIFIVTWLLGIAALSMYDIDLMTAVSAVTSAVSISGFGLGAVGPSGSYRELADGALMILSAIMVLGRLEFVTLLVVFSKGFWQK